MILGKSWMVSLTAEETLMRVVWSEIQVHCPAPGHADQAQGWSIGSPSHWVGRSMILRSVEMVFSSIGASDCLLLHFCFFPPPHFYSVCYMITFFSGTYSQDKLFPLLMSRSSQLKISWPWSISLYPSHPCVCRTPFMVSLRSMQTLGIAEGLMFSKGQSST